MKSLIERPANRALRMAHRIAEAVGARSAQRRVIFMHIPKCAGMSIVSAAKSYLGSQKSGNVVLLDDFMPHEQKRELVARAKDALFVSGHFGFETLEQVRGDAYVFTVLREPYERLRSVYGYMTSVKKRNPLPETFKHLPREEFLASRNDAVLQWTDNMIARAMAQTTDRSDLRFDDLEQMAVTAIKNLGAFDHIGFLNTIERDMATIAQATRVSTFARPPHKNATKSHLKSDRPEAVAPLTEDTRARAFHLVQADLRVYEEALRSRPPTAA